MLTVLGSSYNIIVSITSLYIIALCIFLFGIASLIEIYKKAIRKDKYSDWEIRLIASIASISSALCLYKLDILYPLFLINFNSPIIFDIIFYCVIIYLCQYLFDMKVIKKTVKYLTINYLKKLNFTNDQLEDIFKDK